VTPELDPRWLRLGLPAALALVALAGYGHALGAPFTFDDYANIVDNPWVHWEGLRLDLLWKTAFEGPTARPVAYLSFALNHWAGGLDPWGYRALNVTILWLCGALAFDVQRRLLTRLLPERSAREHLAIAAVGALLFVAHPLQTQAVTYIVQRMTGLSVLGMFAAIAAALRARDATQRSQQLRWGALALAGFAFAMGSKEIAITLPVALWGIEWCAYRKLDARFAQRSLVFLGLPLLLLGVAAYGWLNHDRGWGYAGRPFSAGEHFLTAFRVVAHYTSLVVWPAPSRLNLLHDFELSRGWLDPPTTLASAGLCVAGLGVLAWGIRRRQPLLVFGIGWIYLQLLLESFVLPLALSFEHRMMAPLFGWTQLAAWGIFEALRPRLGAACAVGLVLVGGLTFATHVRNEVWNDELRFWSDVATKSPGLVAAQNNLGNAALRAGDPVLARSGFERGLALDANDVEALANLGALELDTGDPVAAAALLERAVAVNPGHARAHYNLGRARALAGQVDAALRHLQRAVALAPERHELWNGLGAVHAQRGEWSSAALAFEQALQLAPNDPQARSNLAVAIQNARP
jgi:Flp pilus assembly protein TadD